MNHLGYTAALFASLILMQTLLSCSDTLTVQPTETATAVTMLSNRITGYSNVFFELFPNALKEDRGLFFVHQPRNQSEHEIRFLLCQEREKDPQNA